MMNFESCQSLEKLVIDDEICGMAYRLIQGITQREEPMALHVFDTLPSGLNFLAHPHTRQWYRLEHTFPALADRDTYDAWLGRGKKSMADRAGDEVRRALKDHQPELLPDDKLGELKQIMTRYARSLGLAALPLDSQASR